jgi:hypothetical protein
MCSGSGADGLHGLAALGVREDDPPGEQVQTPARAQVRRFERPSVEAISDDGGAQVRGMDAQLVRTSVAGEKQTQAGPRVERAMIAYRVTAYGPPRSSTSVTRISRRLSRDQPCTRCVWMVPSSNGGTGLTSAQ